MNLMPLFGGSVGGYDAWWWDGKAENLKLRSRGSNIDCGTREPPPIRVNNNRAILAPLDIYFLLPKLIL